MNFFKKLISGNISLVKTFWIFYILEALFWQLTVTLREEFIPNIAMFYILILLPIRIISKIIIIVALWNSSEKYTGKRLWFYLVRIYIAFDVILFAYNILNALYYGILIGLKKIF